MALSLDLTLSDIEVRLEEIECLLRMASATIADVDTLPVFDREALTDSLVLVNVSLGLFPPIQERLQALRKDGAR